MISLPTNGKRRRRKRARGKPRRSKHEARNKGGASSFQPIADAIARVGGAVAAIGFLLSQRWVRIGGFVFRPLFPSCLPSFRPDGCRRGGIPGGARDGHHHPQLQPGQDLPHRGEAFGTTTPMLLYSLAGGGYGTAVPKTRCPFLSGEGWLRFISYQPKDGWWLSIMGVVVAHF